MDLSNKATSSLEKDLEVSSSSSDEEVESLPLNEDDLLRLSDGDEETEIPRSQASSSINSHMITGAAGLSTAQENMDTFAEEYPTTNTEVEDGEIEFPDIPTGILSGNNVSRPDIEDIDLDEYCRRRQIHAPPKGYRQQNRHRFQHERYFGGARNATLNINPSEYVSLDDIIKRIPAVGLARDHQTIRRRHHYGGGNGPRIAQPGQNEKLKKGVESITEFHPEPVEPILEPSEQAPEGFPEYRDEPWQCIKKLITKGFSIYWSLMKLKNPQNVDEEDESRLYRCLISYNQIEGLCEAPKMMLAKHGAALDLLGKLSKEFPNLGNFPEKVNEAFLIKQSVWGSLITQMKERHGGQYLFRFNIFNNKVHNRTLFRCVLMMDTSKYEGYSYLSGRAARSVAIKKAYEDLLKEACPMDTIYLGVKKCTTDFKSLYRGVESQMTHCYDFTRSLLVDSKHVREEAKKVGRQRQNIPRRDTCVPVCHVKPQEGPKI